MYFSYHILFLCDESGEGQLLRIYLEKTWDSDILHGNPMEFFEEIYGIA